MTPREQPEQQAPPVQRLRVRYAKRGPARFTSHRDFSRAFERALRRAEVPMAYSSGYSPHPRISYANASPTSAATEAEYLEIGLAQMCDPSRVRDALDAALPPGLVILTVVEADRTSFADLLTASTWSVDMGDVDADVLASAVERLIASDEVHITRMTKSGLRDFDVRAAVIELAVVDDRTLRLVSLQQTPLVRPDDVVAALRKVEPRLDTGRPALLLRIDQGRLVDGAMVTPF